MSETPDQRVSTATDRLSCPNLGLTFAAANTHGIRWSKFSLQGEEETASRLGPFIFPEIMSRTDSFLTRDTRRGAVASFYVYINFSGESRTWTCAYRTVSSCSRGHTVSRRRNASQFFCRSLARRRSLALIHRCLPSAPRTRPHHPGAAAALSPTSPAGLQASTWPSPPGSADRLRGDPLPRTDSDEIGWWTCSSVSKENSIYDSVGGDLGVTPLVGRQA